jgi:hypothetical protein
MRKFQAAFFNKTFVFLPSSFATLGYETPYILKGRYHDPMFIAGRRERAFKSGRRFHAPGKSQQRGQQVTYPALAISLSR